MKRFRSRRLRLLAGVLVSASLVLGLMVFAGLGSSSTSAAAQYAPKNQSPPQISGTAQDNQTLVTTTGQWQGDVTSYTYQWQLCDKNGNNCKNISGATKNSYKVTSKEVGGRIRVLVTAKNKDGSTSAASAPTGVVSAASSSGGGGGTTSNGCDAKGPINVKDIPSPVRLLVDKWQFQPGVITRNTRSFVARIHIADTCGRSVIGALVWSTAIPYSQVSTVQGNTGGDGYATLTFTVMDGFPANPGKQQILAMLVRATDPNGSVLAGKSTRRVLNLPANTT